MAVPIVKWMFAFEYEDLLKLDKLKNPLIDFVENEFPEVKGLGQEGQYIYRNGGWDGTWIFFFNAKYNNRNIKKIERIIDALNDLSIDVDFVFYT